MNRVPYNNPDIIVDLNCGLNAVPAVIDYDGDGYYDLLVSTNSKSMNECVLLYRNYLKENGTTVLGAAEYLTSGLNWPVMSYDVDDNPIMINESRLIYNSFKLGEPLKGKIFSARESDLPVGLLADYNGDGTLDYIFYKENPRSGLATYNSKGQWLQEEYSASINVALNIGTNETPFFETSFTVMGEEGLPLKVDGKQHTAPRLFDWDDDGDLDMIAGGYEDKLWYSKNKGTAANPVWGPFVRLELVGGELYAAELNCLSIIDFDWDRDGYRDLIIGEEDGRVSWLRFTGGFNATTGAPVFDPPVYFRTPADNLAIGALSTPASGDIDGDGDEDLICGDSAGRLWFVENLDNNGGNPIWAVPMRLKDSSGEPIRIMAGTNGSIQGPREAKWGYTVPNVADWDGDGKLDIMINNIWGKVLWYKNISSGNKLLFDIARPVVVEWEGDNLYPRWNWWKPEGKELVSQWRTTPFMIDLNGDELCDLVMSDHEGYLVYYERYEENGELKLRAPKKIFFDAFGDFMRLTHLTAGASGRVKFVLVDWNCDGKLDLILTGTANGSYFENISDCSEEFIFSYVGEVHSRDIAAHQQALAVVDWNGDGIPDILFGSEDGGFFFLANNCADGQRSKYSTALEEACVALWDFEGDSLEMKLSDKATGGTKFDFMRINGSASVSGGIATVPASAGAYLSVSVSDDLKIKDEMTIFLRMKYTGINETWSTILFQDNAYRLYAAGLNNVYFNVYTAKIYKNASSANIDTLVGLKKPDANQWHEVVFTFSLDKSTGELDTVIYLSIGEKTYSGTDFIVIARKSYEGVYTLSSQNNIIFGKYKTSGEDTGVTYYFDKIGYYNRILTKDEMALITAEAGENPYLSQLKSLYSQMTEKDTEGYTPESVEAFEKALARASEVIKDSNSSTTNIKIAINRLNAAASALKAFVPVEETSNDSTNETIEETRSNVLPFIAFVALAIIFVTTGIFLGFKKMNNQGRVDFK